MSKLSDATVVAIACTHIDALFGGACAVLDYIWRMPNEHSEPPYRNFPVRSVGTLMPSERSRAAQTGVRLQCGRHRRPAADRRCHDRRRSSALALRGQIRESEASHVDPATGALFRQALHVELL